MKPSNPRLLSPKQKRPFRSVERYKNFQDPRNLLNRKQKSQFKIFRSLPQEQLRAVRLFWGLQAKNVVSDLSTLLSLQTRAHFSTIQSTANNNLQNFLEFQKPSFLRTYRLHLKQFFLMKKLVDD